MLFELIFFGRLFPFPLLLQPLPDWFMASRASLCFMAFNWLSTSSLVYLWIHSSTVERHRKGKIKRDKDRQRDRTSVFLLPAPEDDSEVVCRCTQKELVDEGVTFLLRGLLQLVPERLEARPNRWREKRGEKEKVEKGALTNLFCSCWPFDRALFHAYVAIELD